MAYKLTTLLNPTNAPTDKQTKFEDWCAEFNALSKDYTEHSANNTNTKPAYDELTARFDYTTDIDAVIDSLKNDYFPNVEWFAIFKELDSYESNTDTYLTDPNYHSPNKTDGLTAPIDIDVDGHTIEYSAIDYLIDGAQYHIDSGTYEVDKPEDTKETKTVYADGNGTLNFDSGLELATLEVHPAKVEVYDVASVEWVTTQRGKPIYTRGDPPNAFIDPDTSWPNATYVTQEGVSQETVDAILTARDNGDIQTQIDHTLDVLDVIDL